MTEEIILRVKLDGPTVYNVKTNENNLKKVPKSLGL